MDKGVHQTVFSNNILNAGALKSENQIGYCNMYENKSSCACMSIPTTKGEFEDLPKCKGMCEKKNVNIYIQSYDNRTNNEKYDLKCDVANVANYSYYNAVKTEQKLSAINDFITDPSLSKNKPLCSEVIWEESLRNIETTRNWESVKNSSNANFVSLLNNGRQFIEERAAYIKGEKGNKPPLIKVPTNMSSRDENSFHNKTNKSVCKINGGKDHIVVSSNSNQIASLWGSDSIASSTCNNLYVAPPFFTVDKFVNQERVGTTQNTQNNMSYSQNIYDGQMVHSNIRFGRNVSGKTVIQGAGNIFLNKEDHHIGVKSIENPIMPFLCLEPSIQSLGVNPHGQHNYLPFENGVFKCQNELIPAKNKCYKRRKYHSGEIRYNDDKTIQTDCMQNDANQIAFSINQCKVSNSIQLKNQNECDFGDTCIRSSLNNITCQDLTHMQFQRNIANETCLRKSSPNCLFSSTKSTIRETRKPNYRALINHVHALRSAQSEDDLNMQIIKRTLNYKANAKEFIGLKTYKSIREVKDATFSNIQNVPYQTICSNSTQERNFLNNTTNIPSPLDLSVKTIKTNADSTENCSNNKQLFVENGYAPRFNFRPDFSDSSNVLTNIFNKTNKIINTTANTLAETGEMNEKESFSVESKFKGNIKAISCCSEYSKGTDTFENERIVRRSSPKLKYNTICDFRRSGNIEGGQQVDPVKVELTLKRTINFDKEDDNNLSHKKNRVENFHYTDATFSESSNTYSENVNFIAIEKTSLIQSLNEIENKNVFTASSNKNEATTQHLHSNPIKTNQNSSSCIAARIRTKGELKGFVFEEDIIQNHKSTSNKENLYCNSETQTTEQNNAVDLNEWGNACNDFVDQLKNNYMHLYTEVNKLEFLDMEASRSSSRKNQSDFKIGLYNILTKSRENIVDKNDVPLKNPIEIGEISVENRTNPLSLKKIACSYLQQNLMTKSMRNIFQHKSDLKSNELKLNKADCIVGNKGASKNSVCIEQSGLKNPSNDSNIERTVCCLKNIENVNKKNIDVVKRTKMSVVRLKREQYGTNRYGPCDKTGNRNPVIKTKADSNSRNCNKDQTPHKFSIISKTTLRRKNMHFDCFRKKQQIVSTNNANIESTCNSITTRMRHQKQQLEKKTATLKKNNKLIKSKRHRHESSNKCPNEDDKIYLEVYRFKRALKIPPNLITIKNTSTQRISASLPDLDTNIQNVSLKNDAEVKNDCKKNDAPKSIIDVLHSRVVKSKNGLKCSQKHLKSGQLSTSKLVMPKFNGTELNIEPLKADTQNHSCREHRNVFETKVLSSRTRMEYKMQLNKDVIREIFGDTERPASAPPEINSNNISYEKDSNETCSRSFQLNDMIIEKKYVANHEKELRTFICENIHKSNIAINTNNHEKVKNIELPSVSIKSKQKRNGRPYRRKFSSGFDYLRKRKKSNTHALYKYPRLSYIAESSYKFKSEEDVARELQKWVLNKGVGQSALHKAARLGYIDIIVYCLEKMGLNPDHKDNAGYTPLHDACVNGSLEIAKVLLQYGANHSEGAHSGIRPLHEASENGHVEIVRMLLSYGADPLLETYSGQTPLMLASDPEMNDFISLHLRDVQVNNIVTSWRFPGPWKIIDGAEEGLDIFNGVSLLDRLYHLDGKSDLRNTNYFYNDNQTKFVSLHGANMLSIRNRSLRNDTADFEFFVDAYNAEGDLFEFEEANMPLPPLYLLKDEGSEKWVLLSDLCNLLKVKSKDTLLHKIFPSISPAVVSRAFVRELKMCEFLEKATCLQLLCAGEKINICHSKVVLVQYNESVRKLLGVNTILMKF